VDLLKSTNDHPFQDYLTHIYQTPRLSLPRWFFTLVSMKGGIMTRRNLDWVQGLGLAATVLALSSLVITDGLQWTSAPAYAGDRGEQRRDKRDDRQDDRQDARDTRQEGREAARDAKEECKKTDGKSNAECRREKRDVKDDARDAAKDIKRD
jgi:hypothetical protein